MKLTNQEKDILKNLIIIEIDYLHNDFDYNKNDIQKLENILKKIGG